MGFSPVHTAKFLLFLVLALGALSRVEPQNEDLFFIRSYQNHGKSYQTHHNACSRKLMCLIASQNNVDIIQGLDYLYGGYEEQEPFRSEKEFLHHAWNMGLKHSSDVRVCSNLNSTHTCKTSSEKLLQAFYNIYKQNEVETWLEETDSAAKHGIEKREARTGNGGGKRLMGMLRRIKLLGRPLLRPDAAKDRAVCVRCEKKRTDCFNFYLGTYGLCGGAWLVAGAIGSATCNIITLPRTIDCTVNAWFNCHQNDCGFVGF